MNNNIEIIKDINENNCVLIKKPCFKGRQKEEWHIIEDYLKKYIGQCFEIEENSEKVFISTDFPDEFANSESRIKLKGAVARAKANSSLAIPEMIQIAENRSFERNRKDKHRKDAEFGWYRYTTRFAIPVYDNEGKIVRLNIYMAKLLVRHANDDKKYLYDIVDIKKETSSPLWSTTVR